MYAHVKTVSELHVTKLTLKEVRVSNFGPYERLSSFFQSFNKNAGEVSSYSTRTMIPLRSPFTFIIRN
jgi:hypothetical protein